MSQRSWGVVLAGGQGRRLASVTGGVPKQYYAPHATRTLLEDTVHRLRPIVTPARMVTVIDRAHAAHAAGIGRRSDVGRIVSQPQDRGTAAGVLLGLSALDAGADELVVLTPSDHGIANPTVFRRGLRRAANALRTGQADVVLFAVAPTSPAGDFGWVMPPAGTRLRPDTLADVGAFVEKPEARRARYLFEGGAAWNTMVLVGRIGAMLELYRRHLPALAAVFADARALPVGDRAVFLDSHYPALPVADFSRDLLGNASGLQTYVWPGAVGWTDLGTPERLQAWLDEHAVVSPGPGRRSARSRSLATHGAAA